MCSPQRHGDAAFEGEAAVPLTWMLRNLHHSHPGTESDCAAEVCREITSRVGPGINMLYIPVYSGKRAGPQNGGKRGGLQTPWLFVNFVSSAAARRAIPLLDQQRWCGTSRVIRATPAHVQGLQGNLALHLMHGVGAGCSLFLFDPMGNPIDVPTAMTLYGTHGNGGVQCGPVPGASQFMATRAYNSRDKSVRHGLAPGDGQYVQSKTRTAGPPARSKLNEMICLYGLPDLSTLYR